MRWYDRTIDFLLGVAAGGIIFVLLVNGLQRPRIEYVDRSWIEAKTIQIRVPCGDGWPDSGCGKELPIHAEVYITPRDGGKEVNAVVRKE